MTNTISTNPRTSISFVQVRSLLCALLALVLFTGCGESGPKVISSTLSEVKDTEHKAAIIKGISPMGVATLSLTSHYGTRVVSDYSWETYRIRETGTHPFNRGKAVWKEYGNSLPYKIEGSAQAGDLVEIIKVVEEKKYDTGEIYRQVTEVKVRSLHPNRTPKETLVKNATP